MHHYCKLHWAWKVKAGPLQQPSPDSYLLDSDLGEFHCVMGLGWGRRPKTGPSLSVLTTPPGGWSSPSPYSARVPKWVCVHSIAPLVLNPIPRLPPSPHHFLLFLSPSPKWSGHPPCSYRAILSPRADNIQTRGVLEGPPLICWPWPWSEVVF